MKFSIYLNRRVFVMVCSVLELQNQGRVHWGFVGFSRTPFPFDLKFQFHTKFWINFIKLEYHIYPKIFMSLTCYLLLLFRKSFLQPVNVCKIAGKVANRVDPDQMPRSAASDLDLHCLLRPVYPNTWSKR